MEVLNKEQKEAVYHKDGPLLIIAGAGSGKTRVIIHRILQLINSGVEPYNIMAITFTNKAAKEMKERLSAYASNYSTLDCDLSSVWISTFHSSCVKILKRYIEKIGYKRDFTIYDRDDQKSLLKSIIKNMPINKDISTKVIINYISNAKNNYNSSKYLHKNATNYMDEILANIYDEYEKNMKKSNALDFDDLLLKTVELLKNNNDIKQYYRNLFKYIMVDEYQDTNAVQFELVSLLCNEDNNICVVGDDDQSIYAFRGADITNILNFEEHFKNTKVIKLEQNYRSSQNILKCANSVIAQNKNRKNKVLWSKKEDKTKIRYKEYDNEDLEAYDIANEIKEECDLGKFNYNQYAILYRTNAQSRLIEKEFNRQSVPYTLVGSISFYQRKEIKDMLAYLKLILNPMDDISFTRIVNVPKRGIGKAALDKLQSFANENNISLLGAARFADKISGLRGALSKLIEFEQLILFLRNSIMLDANDEGKMKPSDLINYIMYMVGYNNQLEVDGAIEAQTRKENIEALINEASDYDDLGLRAFIEEVSLYNDTDMASDDTNRVTLMTLHSAKGLEFDNVYIIGMEQGVFPSVKDIEDDTSGYNKDANKIYDEKELEEERRLCYVGITRARNILRLSSSITKKNFGKPRTYKPSMFIAEMPLDVLDANNYSLRRVGFIVGSDKYVNQMSNNDNVNLDNKNEYKSSFYNRQKSKRVSFGKNIDELKNTKNSYIPSKDDRVKHRKFGEGTVVDIKKIDGDYEISIDFDKSGLRILRLSFAGLIKI